jgi:hypothetical protein
LRPFVLCDIEGGELDLLDSASCPGLRRTDMVVEIHPSGGNDIAEVARLLACRFEETHTAEFIIDSVVLRQCLLDAVFSQAVDRSRLNEFACEQRSFQNVWLALVAKQDQICIQRSHQ